MKRTKAIRRPGKERPATSQSRIQGPPATELHHKNAGRNTKPSDSRPQAKLQRVSIADSSGASPVLSALDHSAKRDLGGASINISRNNDH
jgi:hypothetical protein